MQLNSSKRSHYLFFFAYQWEYMIGFPFHLKEIEVTVLLSFLLG